MHYQRRFTALLAVVALIAIIATVLFGANVRLTQSRTETSTTTAASRQPTGATVTSQTVHYQVKGDSPLARELAAELATTLADAQPADSNEPLNLVVELEESRVQWTPFVSRATMVLLAGFSTNGDFAFLDARPFAFRSAPEAAATPDAGVVQAAIEITLSDRSTGLMSRPGYTDLVAESLAVALEDALQTQLFTMP